MWAAFLARTRGPLPRIDSCSESPEVGGLEARERERCVERRSAVVQCRVPATALGRFPLYFSIFARRSLAVRKRPPSSQLVFYRAFFVFVVPLGLSSSSCDVSVGFHRVERRFLSSLLLRFFAYFAPPSSGVSGREFLSQLRTSSRVCGFSSVVSFVCFSPLGANFGVSQKSRPSGALVWFLFAVMPEEPPSR